MPTRRDPRLPFAMLLTTYAVVGTLFLGFNRSPLQILLTVVSACVLDMGLHAVLRERSLLVPLSAYISSLSLSLLLNYAHSPYLLFLPVFLTIGSKYLLTLHGRHLYNPSMFGVVVTLLVSGGLITTAPAYQWGGTWAVSAFMVTAALALFVFRVDRVWLVASFLVFYALQTAFRAYVMRHHLPAEALFLGTISSPPFYLFCFFMLTDPRTYVAQLAPRAGAHGAGDHARRPRAAPAGEPVHVPLRGVRGRHCEGAVRPRRRAALAGRPGSAARGAVRAIPAHRRDAHVARCRRRGGIRRSPCAGRFGP
ncbi:MAG: hypothetical protein M3P48_03550 [Actinomycetota bacterium]|nr:hypothetical protein [Actinomycetota bacterium]